MRAAIFILAAFAASVALSAAYLLRKPAPKSTLDARKARCPHDHGERYASGGVEWCGGCGKAVGSINVS